MDMREKHEVCEKKSEDYLYKIGMFATMNHVTVKTLRFYEAQGLLAPAYIDEENGYRYYKMSQMPVIHQITALKQAGFTLEDIMKINGGYDEKTFLMTKKAELLKKIAEITMQLSIIDGFLAKQTVNLSTPVLVKTVPAVNVAMMRETIESYDDLFTRMPELGIRMEEAGCQCSVPEYCYTSYPEPGYKEENIPVELCEAITKLQKNREGLSFKHVPETQAACIYHKGSYADFRLTYERVLKYIEENDYVINGDIREVYIDGVWNKNDESEWLSEIQIPVRKR